MKPTNTTTKIQPVCMYHTAQMAKPARDSCIAHSRDIDKANGEALALL